MASKELDALIAQYLRKNGRTKTLAAFTKECHPVLDEAPSEDLEALMTWYRARENAGKKADDVNGEAADVVAKVAEEKTVTEAKSKGKKPKKGKAVEEKAVATEAKDNTASKETEEAGTKVILNAAEDTQPKTRGRKAKKVDEVKEKAAVIETTDNATEEPVAKEPETKAEAKKKGRKGKKVDEVEQKVATEEQVAKEPETTVEAKKKGRKGKKVDEVEPKAADIQTTDNATDEQVAIEPKTKVEPKKKGRKGKKVDEVEEKNVSEPTSNKRKTRNSNKPVESVPEEAPKKKARKGKASKLEQAEPVTTEVVVEDKPSEATEAVEKPELVEVEKDANAPSTGVNGDVPEPQKKKKGRKNAKAGKEEENHNEEEPAAKKQKTESSEQLKEVNDHNEATGGDSDTAKNGDEAGKTPNSGNRKKSDAGNVIKPFQRVNPNEVEFLDDRLKDNSYWAKDGAENGWGAKAQEVLGQVKGRGFRHEKTKKKRGTYKGGSIDTQAHSIKFNYD